MTGPATYDPDYNRTVDDDSGVDTSKLESPAAKLVPQILEAVDRETSQQFEDRAVELARRADLEHPINRSPSGVASGAVYAAGLLVNEKVHQDEVAEAAGVITNTIRASYNEIFDHEDIATKTRHQPTRRARQSRAQRPEITRVFDRLRGLFDR